jgi:hypothetical protein
MEINGTNGAIYWFLRKGIIWIWFGLVFTWFLLEIQATAKLATSTAGQ